MKGAACRRPPCPESRRGVRAAPAPYRPRGVSPGLLISLLTLEQAHKSEVITVARRTRRPVYHTLELPVGPKAAWDCMGADMSIAERSLGCVAAPLKTAAKTSAGRGSMHGCFHRASRSRMQRMMQSGTKLPSGCVGIVRYILTNTARSTRDRVRTIRCSLSRGRVLG